MTKPIEDRQVPKALSNARSLLDQLVLHWEGLPLTAREDLCGALASVFVRMTQEREETTNG